MTSLVDAVKLRQDALKTHREALSDSGRQHFKMAYQGTDSHWNAARYHLYLVIDEYALTKCEQFNQNVAEAINDMKAQILELALKIAEKKLLDSCVLAEKEANEIIAMCRGSNENRLQKVTLEDAIEAEIDRSIKP